MSVGGRGIMSDDEKRNGNDDHDVLRPSFPVYKELADCRSSPDGLGKEELGQVIMGAFPGFHGGTKFILRSATDGRLFSAIEDGVAPAFPGGRDKVLALLGGYLACAARDFDFGPASEAATAVFRGLYRAFEFDEAGRLAAIVLSGILGVDPDDDTELGAWALWDLIDLAMHAGCGETAMCAIDSIDRTSQQLWKELDCRPNELRRRAALLEDHRCLPECPLLKEAERATLAAVSKRLFDEAGELRPWVLGSGAARPGAAGFAGKPQKHPNEPKAVAPFANCGLEARIWPIDVERSEHNMAELLSVQVPRWGKLPEKVRTALASSWSSVSLARLRGDPREAGRALHALCGALQVLFSGALEKKGGVPKNDSLGYLLDELSNHVSFDDIEAIKVAIQRTRALRDRHSHPGRRRAPALPVKDVDDVFALWHTPESGLQQKGALARLVESLTVARETE